MAFPAGGNTQKKRPMASLTIEHRSHIFRYMSNQRKTRNQPGTMRELLYVMKALSDESRLRVVAALQEKELCLCQIVELLGLAPSTVSRHMSILEHARVVQSRKHGRWAYFCLASADASRESAKAISLVLDTLGKDDVARSDARRLKAILKVDPEQLCRRQSECKR